MEFAGRIQNLFGGDLAVPALYLPPFHKIKTVQIEEAFHMHRHDP